jgi:DNA modification methylase
MELSDVKPYERNAKKHPDKQIDALANVVKVVGWRQPVVINQQGVIVVGHGRWLVWQKHQQQLPPIWVIDDAGQTVHGEPDKRTLTAEQEKMWRLADNQLNALTGFDMKLVIDELKGLSPEMVELTGFSKDLIIEPDAQDDVIPGVPAQAKSQVGDVYQLDDHKVMCGDSTNREHVAHLMDGAKSDMVFTDPPYNIAYKGQGENTSNEIMGDDVAVAEFDAFLDKVFANYAEFTKAGGGNYVFHASRTQSSFEKALAKNGYAIKNQLIWNKPMSALGWGDYRWKHEPFFYAGKKDQELQFYGDRTHSTVWDFQKTEAELLLWAKRQKRAEMEGKTTVWSMKRDNVHNYLHPTQKPVELVCYAIQNSSKADDIVLDLFLGSGSTLIAAQKMERICYGMELDQRYADVAVQRWVDYTGNTKILKNGQEEVWQITPKTAPTETSELPT